MVVSPCAGVSLPPYTRRLDKRADKASGRGVPNALARMDRRRRDRVQPPAIQEVIALHFLRDELMIVDGNPVTFNHAVQKRSGSGNTIVAVALHGLMRTCCSRIRRLPPAMCLSI